MQDIASIGYMLVIGFMFALIAIWMAGRRGTTKLRNKIAQDIASRFPKVTSKISVKLLGSTGAKFSLHQVSNSPFQLLELTILLLDRSNPFHMLYSRARKRTDQIQIRVNAKRQPPFRLELTTREEQERLEEALIKSREEMQELLIKSLSDRFYISTNNAEASESLFHRSHIRSTFDDVAPYLTRLSIDSREPHLFISTVLVPQVMEPLEEFTLSMIKAIDGKYS